MGLFFSAVIEKTEGKFYCELALGKLIIEGLTSISQNGFRIILEHFYYLDLRKDLILNHSNLKELVDIIKFNQKW